MCAVYRVRKILLGKNPNTQPLCLNPPRSRKKNIYGLAFDCTVKYRNFTFNHIKKINSILTCCSNLDNQTYEEYVQRKKN